MSVKRLERAASKDQATSSKGISTKEGPPTSPVWRPSSKIRDRHWERLAIVYIRQSSPHQVLENRESREWQYALAKVAEQLGWPADRVLVIVAQRVDRLRPLWTPYECRLPPREGEKAALLV